MSSLPVIVAAGEPSFTPSNYMPSFMVEIAFNAGYVTPAADRVWTDVTDYVELTDQMTVGVGRQDERSTADANDLTLTLDNTDGRFTANRAASPYYPNVKIGRPIRVSATVNGQAFIRFVGFVDEWPVEWDGTDAYAKVTIRATSRLARLGLNAKLRSMIEEEVLSDSPTEYWTLGDPSGATSASESSGNNGTPLTVTDTGTEVVFGSATGPGSDGLTAAQFAAGQYLAGEVAAPSTINGVRFTLLVSASSTGAVVFAQGEAVLTIDASGRLSLSTETGPVLLGPVVTDGTTHDVFLAHSGGTATLYVDGAGSSTASNPKDQSNIWFGQGLTGVMSHIAIWTGTAPSAARIAVQSSAVATGFAGDRTDVRLLRILGWAGVASTEVNAETGSETMTYQQTSGQSVVDALRDVESTEGGVLFDGPDGNVKFHNRSRRYQKTASATLDMASQHVGADYAPKLDRSTLVNDATVDNPTTGETARAVDTTSSDEYGIATTSAKSVADSYDPLQQKASWLVASYAEPRNRVPSLTVDVLAHQGLTPSAQTLLGITVGDLLVVTNAPSQSDTTSPSYFVEGYTEVIGPESYEITFNLSPTYPYLNTFVIGDATRGQIETGGVLAL